MDNVHQEASVEGSKTNNDIIISINSKLYKFLFYAHFISPTNFCGKESSVLNNIAS